MAIRDWPIHLQPGDKVLFPHAYTFVSWEIGGKIPEKDDVYVITERAESEPGNPYGSGVAYRIDPPLYLLSGDPPKPPFFDAAHFEEYKEPPPEQGELF